MIKQKVDLGKDHLCYYCHKQLCGCWRRKKDGGWRHGFWYYLSGQARYDQLILAAKKEYEEKVSNPNNKINEKDTNNPS